MNLLVAGARRVDDGKTTFAVGLVDRLETRVGGVVGPIDPEATVPLPALAGERRADAATAYGAAYDALLDVARN